MNSFSSNFIRGTKLKVTKQVLKCYAKLIFAAPEKERLNYQRNLAEIQQAMKEEEIIEHMV